MIKKYLATVFFFFLTLNLFSQKSDSSAFRDFKKFLPYVIKGISSDKAEEPNQIIGGKFFKPVKIDTLNDSVSRQMLEKVEENASFKIEKDYASQWKLNFSSKLKDFETMDEILKSKRTLSNVYIEVSDINILDENGESIYYSNPDRKIINNERTKLNFVSGQINTTFPIKGEYANAKGSIKVTLKEYSEIQFKEFNKSQTDINFDLHPYEHLKLLRISKNRAYFILPTLIEDVQITGTNENNEVFTKSSVSKLSKKIYDFGNRNELTESEINEFVESLTFEDAFKSKQMYIYETSGDIENLYIYIKSDPKELGSKILNIKI